jgi:PAS domain S-box-containing protein
VNGPVLDTSQQDAPRAATRALLERLSGTGVLVLDGDLRVRLCTGDVFAAAGWDTELIEGNRLADILPASSLALVEPHYAAALAGETRSFRMRAGTDRVYKIIASPLTDVDGAPDGVFVITVDATGEADAELRLREAQALLRCAFDAAPAAMVVFSAAPETFGRVIQANTATSRLFGYAPDDITAGAMRAVFPVEEADDVERELRRLAAEGGTIEAQERRLVDAGGRQLWGRLHVSFTRGEDGRPELGIAQIEDVTKERMREEALRFSEERFGLIFHKAPVGMAMADLEGTLLEVNDAFAELVGRPLESLPGMPTAAITHPDDGAIDHARLAPLARGEIDHYVFHKRFVRPDGEIRIARMRIAAIHDVDGIARYAIGVAVDVTDQLRAEAAHAGIVDSVFDGIIAIDGEGLVTFFNPAAERMFGAAAEEVLGRDGFELFVPPELHGAFQEGMEAMWRAERDATVADHQRVELQRIDGTPFPAEISVRRTGRDPVEFSAFVRDLTEERRAERRRRGAEDMFRSVFENSAIAMAVLNLTGLCLEANSELCRFLGRTAEELRGLTIADVTHPDDHVPTEHLVAALEEHGSLRREKRFVRGDGQVVWGFVHSSLLFDEHGRPRGLQSQIVDITAQREATARLSTVLESLAEGVLVIDAAGNVEKVNPAARRLLGWPDDQLIGRPAGATLFVAHDEGPCPLAAVASGAEALRVDDAGLRRVDGSVLPASYSAAPLGANDDGGIVVVFTDISERKAREQNLRRRLSALDLLEQTRTALASDRLVLHSQPILDVASGTVVQEELLLRMLGPDGELIPPGDFLPLAEEYGLIAAIDRWVIGEAAKLAAQGRHVEVNVSGRTLGHRDLAQWVDEALAATGADPQLMTFEITETALTNDLEQAVRFAERIHAIGCGFALDDFGTGYGSFTLLKRLPISYLKIDMEFVRDLLAEEANRHVVQAVVGLARGLGMRTIAEGVEDQATLDVLAELGVDYAQGFHIGRPAPL